ncbi:MAG: hypothetical protein MZW92_45985 [Comamonadaceae bacterium]|nr:hypothetical protein [Comamonadaceae bacterium]
MFAGAGRGWMSDAVSAPVAAPASPAGVGGNGFSPVAKVAMPAVVNISTSRTVRQQGGPHSPFMNDPLFRHFFGDEYFPPVQRDPRERRENSLGSGVIVDADGLHRHQRTTSIEKRRRDQGAARRRAASSPAKVVGHRPEDRHRGAQDRRASDLPVVDVRRLRRIEVGDYVLAIGNPFGVGQTVTLGHRQRARPRQAWASTTTRTSSRPTPPSTPATPAARWSIPAASWSASTPPSISRTGGIRWASASRSRATWRNR